MCTYPGLLLQGSSLAGAEQWERRVGRGRGRRTVKAGPRLLQIGRGHAGGAGGGPAGMHEPQLLHSCPFGNNTSTFLL